jgi:hypothetical protein
MSQVPAEQQLPTPPTLPTPPASPTFTFPGQSGTETFVRVPTTAREMAALRQRGEELSRQLRSVSGRRNELAGQLDEATGTNRAGIEQRIAQLDARIMGIEADIAQNGRLLASAPANLLNVRTETGAPPPRGPFGMNPGQLTGVTIVGTIFVLFPLAIAMARNIWRRGSRQAPAPVSQESTERMERLEQAVDAISIEIERISEGQRFVTRLLTEGSASALAVGQKSAEPVRLPDREAMRAARETA